MHKPLKYVLEQARRQFLIGSASLGAILGFTLNGFASSTAFTATALDDRTQANLATLVRRMFPHQHFNEAAFRGVADTIAAEAGTSMPLTELLNDGIASLDAAQDPYWLDASEKNQLAAMQTIQEKPFFQYVLNKSIDVLYRDQSLLSTLGYEGSSIEKGGYIQRGFNDIDWLP